MEEVLGLTKVSQNLQTRIPKDVAELLKVKEGDRILWVKEGERIYVKKAEIK
ncbi:MAG: AbrB/MazE/SpoVT family DNA-binding domain-containing protein [Aigarchaeota archaeon]|nr:AbrB/MazE/SpoVT family DNA-binding domain-containing protein [Candidatus Wolframiiraptor gerlachensis]